MLKDLSGPDWIKMLGIPADRVPRVAILRGTRNLRRQYERYSARFSDLVELGSPNGLFEDLFIARHGDMNVGYASVYGCSMASEITHLFGVLGTRLIIQTGCCGGLQPGVQTGDLVIPGRAIPGEGAAQYYMTGEESPRASADLIRPAASLVRSCWPYHTGVMYTTSALLAEGQEELEAWQDAGHAAVDMETATTFAVAQFFDMKRLAVLYVFDNPLYGDSLVDTHEERNARRQRGEEAMTDVVTRLLDKLHRDGIESAPASPTTTR
jgi:purine-nucleoside phosphorylase